MAEIPAPKPYWFVTVFNTVLRFAINGLGASAAETAIMAQVPWLPPSLVKWVVGTFLKSAEKEIEIGADKVLLRFSGDIREAQYEQAIKPIREKEVVTDEELRAAQEAIHHILHHGGD